MSQQEQMLTATQNELSHAPPIHLYLTLVTSCQHEFSCLSSRREMVTTATGSTGVCSCSSQQIQTQMIHPAALVDG